MVEWNSHIQKFRGRRTAGSKAKAEAKEESKSEKAKETILDKSIPIRFSCIVWLVVCFVIYMILNGIIGQPLTIFAWLVGLDPSFVILTILFMSFFVTLMVVIAVRKV